MCQFKGISTKHDILFTVTYTLKFEAKFKMSCTTDFKHMMDVMFQNKMTS